MSKAKEKETNALVVAAQVPAFMEEDASVGKESIGKDDVVLPRLSLCQGLSPQVEDKRATLGQFWHNIEERGFDGPLNIVAVAHHKRFVLFDPQRGDGGRILARASDGVNWDVKEDFTVNIAVKGKPENVVWSTKAGTVSASGLASWGSSDPSDSGSPPAATEVHSYICVDVDNMDRGPFVIDMQRSANKVAKAWNSKILAAKAPIFGQVYSLTSESVTGPSGGFQQWKIAGAGFVKTQELYDQLKEQSEKMREHKLADAPPEGETPKSEDKGEGKGGDVPF